jgi:hypothetical protein
VTTELRELEEVIHEGQSVETGGLGLDGLGNDQVEELPGSAARVGEVGEVVAESTHDGKVRSRRRS